MRVVLYSNIDLEPITVIDVPRDTLDWLDREKLENRHIEFAVMQEILIEELEKQPSLKPFKTVHVTFEKLYRRDKWVWTGFTDDEEVAMTMRTAFMPGQRLELERCEKIAMAEGYMAALLGAIGRVRR